MSHPPRRPGNEIIAALALFRSSLCSVGLFTAVVNLLMLAPALYMLQVYDRVLASGNGMTLLMLTLMTLGLLVFMGTLEFVRSLVVIRIGSQLDLQLNQRVYNAAFEASLKSGEQTTGQAFNDLAQLRQFVTGPSLFALFDAPWFPIYLAVIFLFDTWLGLFALAGSILLLALAWLNERVSAAPLAEASRQSIRCAQQASGTLRNAEVIESMGMLGALRERWFAGHGEFLRRQGQASERTALVAAAAKIARVALQSLVLGLGAWLVLEQRISPGMMIAGSILMGRVLAPLDQLIGAWKHWAEARLAFQRLSALLSNHPPRPVGMPLPLPRGHLAVDGISACAPGSRQPVLSGLGFTLPAGDTLGIVGASGSGKSSLARLLVGAWVPQLGKVRLDGADLQGWDRTQLGAHIGYLPQDVQLFAGSVAENIARFAEVDAEKVVAAARMAGVHELILRLPQGYDTVLGEGGAGLSGGQKQRVGLARALYGLPALVVLDEPNANLDEEGEQALLDAIAQLKRLKRTLVLVSHKPTLLEVADQLLILRGGRALAFGPAARVLQDMPLSKKPAATPRTAVASAPVTAFSLNYQLDTAQR